MTTTQPKTDYKRKFKPADYLKHYFSEVDNTNKTILKFRAQVVKNHDITGAKILDFGCGPCIDAIISFAPGCAEIHMTDYLEENLREIQRWVEKAPEAFNWNHFLHQVLRLEAELSNSDAHITEMAVAERAEIIRHKMTRFMTSDAREQLPLGAEYTQSYDVIVTSFCVEVIATNLTEWQQLVRNMLSLLKPKGLLVWFMTDGSTDAYQVGPEVFPLLGITRQDIEAVLNDLIVPKSLQIDYINVTEHELIQGIHMVTALKNV